MVDQAGGLGVVRQMFERIVASPQHIIVLETAQVADTLAQMRVFAMRGGASIYAWEPEGGLAALRESGLFVPGSRRLTDAFRYVMQSTHFGIYLFAGFQKQLTAVEILLLRRMSRGSAAHERKLVLMGEQVAVPEELDGFYELIDATAMARPHLRLRDGRWVA